MMADEDNVFGPQLRGFFDFTLLFEQSILSILPTALLIVLAPFRITYLLRNDIRVKPGRLLWLKLAAIAVFFCLQVVLAVLWALPSTPKTQTSIAESVLSLIEALAIAALSFVEHRRSIRPSGLLSGYLFLTIILDIAQVRTFWIRDGLTAVAAVFTVSLVIKAAILLLEETPKRPLLPAGLKGSPVESTTGIVNRSVFWWLNTLFLQGFKLLLVNDDLGAIDKKFDSRVLLSQLEHAWSKSKKTNAWSLIWCAFSAYRVTFIAAIIPRLLFAGFTFSQPLLVNRIIDFVGEPWDDTSKSTAAGLVGATAVIYVGLAISRCWYEHLTYQLMTLFRGGLVSLIFKKTLQLDVAVVQDSAPVTLMSTDIDAITISLRSVHDVWASLIELPIGVYLLYRQVGAACFLLLIPGTLGFFVSARLSISMGPARVAWNEGVQKRVALTSSMLAQIKGIKMMGLTEYFAAYIQGLRVTELKLSVTFRLLLVWLSTIALFSEQITPTLIIAAAVFWTREGQSLTVAEAFTALSIIVLVSHPLVQLMGAIMHFFGALGCYTRIHTFLVLNEQEDQRQFLPGSSKSSIDSSIRPSSQGSDLQPLSPRDALTLDTHGDKPIELRPIQDKTRLVEFDKSKNLVVVDGATFSLSDGTEVLQDITMTLRQATISMVVGRVGSGKSSLLKAVMGELNMTKGSVILHTSSVAYCDQTAWLRNITVRENIIGRAAFDSAWFSAVVVACTLDEDIASFPFAENTIVGSGGVALSGGQRQRVALARAVYSRRKLLLLDDVFSGLDNSTSKAVFQRLLGPDGLLRMAGMTVLLATNHINFLPSADFITVLDTGNVTYSQVPFASVDRSVWGNLSEEFKGKGIDLAPEEPGPMPVFQNKAVEPVVPGVKKASEAELTRQTGDSECYKIYFKSIGWGTFLIFVGLVFGLATSMKLPQIWLRIWTEHGTTDRPGMYLGVYVCLALICTAFAAASLGFWMLAAIPKSANHLHGMLLKAVLAAPLYFYTATDSGVTLNRFSQDMTLIDQRLPMSAFATAHGLFMVISETALIASGATYVAAAIPFSFIALYFLQMYYLRTSRQIRHLDLETKSPLFTQFTETLAGLSTIRAFGWKRAFLRENHQLLDTSQKPFYLLFCIQRWLNVVLDLFVAGLALLLVALAVNFTSSTSKGAIGLAMVSIIGFNKSLGFLIEQWTFLETSLGAIARLKYFMANTPQEDREVEVKLPPSDWPALGMVEIEDLTAAYSDDSVPVLQKVSLTIQPGQRIGICGRSGSGKSSLVLTILRLLELKSGTIRIDNQDLSTMPRQKIRSLLTTLPQEPVTLAGSIRHNLDPHDSVSADEPLIAALRKTSIWETIESRGGLDAQFTEIGFSVGQQQLFCLARALLGRSRVLLLDEATSSVDRQTDEEVRRLLKEEFRHCTVVEVAHRLDGIVDFDVVVVMAEGRVVEVGRPRDLLEGQTKFRSLWDDQGS